MVRQGRRSFLATLAVLGTASTVPGEGLGMATEKESRSGKANRTPAEQSLGTEVVDLDTGDRTVIDGATDPDTVLDPGRYERIDVSVRGETIVEERSYFRVDDTEWEPTAEHLELEAEVEWDVTELGPYGPNATVPLLFGAVEQDGDTPVAPAANVPLEVIVEDPDDEVYETYEVTTGDDGNARLDIELSDAPSGRFSVDVESTETEDTAWTSFTVGRRANVSAHTDLLQTGEPNTLALFSFFDGELEDGVTDTVTVTGPEGEETIDVQIDDGIGLFDVVPSVDGEYDLESEAEFDYTTTNIAGDYRVFVPGFDLIRDRPVAQTGSFGGIIFGPDGVASNTMVTFRAVDSVDGVIVEETTQTDDSGVFVVEFEGPAGFEYTSVEVDVDGTSAAVDSRISFEGSPFDPPSDSDSDPIELDVSFDQGGPIGVDTDIDATVTLTESGDPIAGEEIDIVHLYDDIPLGGEQVVTDSTGEAATTLSVPPTATDSDVEVIATTAIDGTQYVGSDDVEIERFVLDFSGRFDLTPGETTTIDLVAKDRASGDRVDGLTVPAVTQSRFDRSQVYDDGTFETDSNGTASRDFSVPAEATGIVGFTRSEPGINVTYLTSLNRLTPFDVDLTVQPADPSPGDTITVEYTTDATTDTSAIVAFPKESREVVALAKEGEPIEVEVPTRFSPGDSPSLIASIVTPDGTVANTREEVEISDGLAVGFATEPERPTIGEEVTFYDVSETPAPAIDTREWYLSGDGTVDATGETATFSYDEGGRSEVTLTVTDSQGRTDSWTWTVPIEDDGTPTASFAVTTEDPVEHESVNVQDTSTAGDAPIVDREWDLTGDGSVDATGGTATITYESPGQYTVTLTVTDDNGEGDETEQVITVDERSADDYVDEDSGEVETGGLRNAVEDWQNEDIDSGLLTEIIESWAN